VIFPLKVVHKEGSEIGETNQKKKKIIISDSHARGCAREISNYLGKEFEVSGTVMPGVGLAHITTLAHEEISNLISDDAVVIWGGSYNVSKNEMSRGLRHLQNFINHRSNTNILALAHLIGMTYRRQHALIRKLKYSVGNYIRSSKQRTM